MKSFRSRIIEPIVEARLRTHGAVLIDGPKAVGKTTTARAFTKSEVRLDQDRAALTAARVDPRLVLDGDLPRLVDEYQLVPGLWNAVRGRIDDLGAKGLFLLTGSATPEPDGADHTGARRIAPVRMRTMSFHERGSSSGVVSLGRLLAGDPLQSDVPDADLVQIVEALAVGGWPDNLGLDVEDALDANVDYLTLIANTDVRRVDGVRRNPDTVRRLIAGYARNTSTDASLRAVAQSADSELADSTVHDYVDALRRLFLVEDQPAWSPRLRSRIRLAKTPKRHLADPSLAVAALGADVGRLLGPEINLTGFLFESQVIHDLRIYAQPHWAEVRFYRDNKGLETDAIVEVRDGSWIGVEVKLGPLRIDAAAASLLAMRAKLADDVREACRALMVVVAIGPTYVREDGVVVTSLASLGP